MRQISCGEFHCACLAEPGYIYTWGAGYGLGRARSDWEEEAKASALIKPSPKSHSLGLAGMLLDVAAEEADDCCEMKELPFFYRKKMKQVRR